MKRARDPELPVHAEIDIAMIESEEEKNWAHDGDRW